MTFLKRETVKFFGGKKYAIQDHMIQLVVWTQLRFVERVARLTDFFGIKIPVRRRNLEPAFLFIDELL